MCRETVTEPVVVPLKHGLDPVPFPDEPFARNVEVLPYQQRWAREGAQLVARLETLLPRAVAIDHIGSTAVPGLPAKDCIDAMVRVRSLDEAQLRQLSAVGFRQRPEQWNLTESVNGTQYRKRVFAPPVGGRPVNIHIREADSATSRYSLLFRDYLRANSHSRDAWGTLKVRLAEDTTDLHSYGQLKATVQPLLMALAERWATETSWRP
jgi:GrpB-like predicted nucleotidyltransferase (UPF0157 family)